MKYKEMDNLVERIELLRGKLENDESKICHDCCDSPSSVGGWNNFGQFADYG